MLMALRISRRHARREGQCKKRNGNSKKESKEMLEIKNTKTEMLPVKTCKILSEIHLK